MPKPKLSDLELQICNRLKYAREHVLKMTQAACADEMNLDRSTLANYETGRTPLRFEVALRFCRQFIISEEWLATGRFEIFHLAAIKHGIGKPEPGNNRWEQFDDIVSIRQCVDLLSDHSFLHIKSGCLYSEAFASVLGKRYGDLVESEFRSMPRVVFSDADKSSLVVNFLMAIHGINIGLLQYEAALHGQLPSELWRLYARYSFECTVLIYHKLRGGSLPPNFLSGYDWLRDVLSNPDAVIGPIKVAFEDLDNKSKEKDLPYSESSDLIGDVKARMSGLVDRLKEATAAPGKKTELAEFLSKTTGDKVPLASVSRWLAGEREPGGEIALQMDAWATKQGFPK